MQPKAKTVEIVNKISFSENHPFVEAFDRIKKIAGDTLVKYTIPSPSMLYHFCVVRNKDYAPIALYKDNDELLFDDIANAWIEAAKELYAH